VRPWGRLEPERHARAQHHPRRPEVAGATRQPDPDQEEVDDPQLAGRGPHGAAPPEGVRVGLAGEVRAPRGRRAEHRPGVQRDDQRQAQQRPHRPRVRRARQGPDRDDDERHRPEYRRPHAQAPAAAKLELLGVGVAQHTLRQRPEAERLDPLHQRNRGQHARAAAGAALDRERAIERPHPILQALQPRATVDLGAADAVIGHGHEQLPVARRHRHPGSGRLGVLADVRQALRDHEVGRGLDLVGQPIRRGGDYLDRNRSAPGEVVEGSRQATVREDRRVDAAR